MTKIADPNIASVAKQATDGACIVAMVNVEGTFSSWRIGPTNRASPLLLFEQAIEFASLDSIVFLSMIIAKSSRVGLSATRLIGRSLFQIGQTPLGVALYCARAAINAIAMLRVSGPKEVSHRKIGPALRASFEAGGKVKCVSRHRISYTSNLSLTQGAF